MNYYETYFLKLKKFIELFFLQEYQTQLILDVERILSNKNSKLMFEQLNKVSSNRLCTKDFSKDIVEGTCEINEFNTFKSLINELKPWRKGPFKLNEYLIDSEWQCQLKWNRLKTIQFSNTTILDVGAGNGYYMYKMLGESATKCLGLDPHLLYMHQHLVLDSFFQSDLINLMPLGWQICDKLLPSFDYVVCMGVLYHQKNPEILLEFLKRPLKPNGVLILETLIIDSEKDDVLIPKDRYAAMKNVFQIPSINRLKKWLKRLNYKNIDILDINQTSIVEQRQTSFSSGMSLVDFLDPNDSSLTVEGYPRPLRVLLKANI